MKQNERLGDFVKFYGRLPPPLWQQSLLWLAIVCGVVLIVGGLYWLFIALGAVWQ